ncbi:MAG: ATP-binding protein [Xenococcus sp. MO_188.B8]|nr:ATP-binding protein [Xenococcus sp. MO_188.B8]
MNTFNLELVDITKILDEVKYTLESRLPDFISLEFQTNPNVQDCQVNTDLEQIKMIILELVENSKKSFHGMSSGKIIVEALKKEDNFLVFVKDNGSGISDEIKQKLFVEKIASNNGTGLGLFLCNKILQELNGELTFVDVDTPGSEFMISLPLINK